MCGISAVLMTDGRVADAAVVERMNSAQQHRGPDGAGIEARGPAALGHRRLAIIDLVGGKQPLSNEDGTVWITFNGEIYNYRALRRELEGRGHRFRTDSDTETIVHAYEQWGDRCVERLRGMFAFVIWDERRRELFLARDRFGIKPLVYWEGAGIFAAASELLGIKAHPEFQGTIDVAALDQYLHYQYIPAPSTIYREVRKLPPATTLVIKADGTHGAPRKYWDFAFVPDRRLDEAAWVERLDAALDETVTAHLVADVPFGAFLSGGIDSSTIVAYMARRLNQPVRSFTIAHHSASYDERAWAEEAARVTGAEHHLETVEPDAQELLPALVRHYGEPFADSSAVATMRVSGLARRHVKMVLSGDGGDELFAGYHSYPAILWDIEPRLDPFRRAKRWIGDRLRDVGWWPKRITAADLKYARTAMLPADLRHRLWRAEHSAVVERTRAQFDQSFTARAGEGLLGRLQHHDVCNYIAYDNLPKVDIATMMHGLESRVPLLDHVFLETARQIPPELKLRLTPGAHGTPDALVGKYLLKRNAERFFSPEFLHRPKRGFEVPVREWFGGSFSGTLRERLAGADAPLTNYFEPVVLAMMVDDAATDRPAAWRAWTLLVLDEWLRQDAASKTSPRLEPSLAGPNP
jgi:asparagine synthase (glutamine-hydrolysing)